MFGKMKISDRTIQTKCKLSVMRNCVSYFSLKLSVIIPLLVQLLSLHGSVKMLSLLSVCLSVTRLFQNWLKSCTMTEVYTGHGASRFTIRYDIVYLTCSKKLTGSQVSLRHGMNKTLKCKTKNKLRLYLV